MRFFKQKLLISIFILSLFLTPALVFAQGADLLTNAAGSVAGQSGVNTQTNIPGLISNIVTALTGIVAVVFLVFAVLGGVMWIMAGGNEEKVIRAKKFIVGGIEGMIITFLSYAIIYFVLQALNQGAGT